MKKDNNELLFADKINIYIAGCCKKCKEGFRISYKDVLNASEETIGICCPWCEHENILQKKYNLENQHFIFEKAD